MLRGFLVAAGVLIVLEVLLQPGASDAVGSGGTEIAALAARVLSAGVAGVPNRAKTTASTSSSSSTAVTV